MSNTTRFLLILVGVVAFLSLFVVDLNVHGAATWWSYAAFLAVLAYVVVLLLYIWLIQPWRERRSRQQIDAISRNEFPTHL